jgi:hypothetical protein
MLRLIPDKAKRYPRPLALAAREFGFRPYARATIGDVEVEIISFPYSDDDCSRLFVLARTTPGDPLSIERFEIDAEAIADLSPPATRVGEE